LGVVGEHLGEGLIVGQRLVGLPHLVVDPTEGEPGAGVLFAQFGGPQKSGGGMVEVAKAMEAATEAKVKLIVIRVGLGGRFQYAGRLLGMVLGKEEVRQVE
jgi:hypothetical protein